MAVGVETMGAGLASGEHRWAVLVDFRAQDPCMAERRMRLSASFCCLKVEGIAAQLKVALRSSRFLVRSYACAGQVRKFWLPSIPSHNGDCK